VKKISYCFLYLLAFWVGCQDQPKVESKLEMIDGLPVISKVEQLKTIKGKQIIWQKDGARMMLIPAEFEVIPQEVKEITPAVYNEVGDLITPQREVITPEKKVQISNSFFMDAYEVTVGQFKIFLKSSGYKPYEAIDWNQVYKYSPTEKYPMIAVTWHDAVAYAKWSSKRLPTEKEWEYAARGGLVGKEFPWGYTVFSVRGYANYKGTGGKDKWQYTAPVGSFKPNGYGLYDMAGNIEEWCQDWPESDHMYKVLRGGAWHRESYTLRVDSRSRAPIDLSSSPHIGFRCVADVE